MYDNADFPYNIRIASRLLAQALVIVLSPDVLDKQHIVVTSNQTKVANNEGVMVIHFKIIEED
jgi:hypothetical protein